MTGGWPMCIVGTLTMQDALLNRTLRLTIVGTASVMSLACLLLAYAAIFDCFAQRWADAAAHMVWSAGAAIEIVDRRQPSASPGVPHTGTGAGAAHVP